MTELIVRESIDPETGEKKQETTRTTDIPFLEPMCDRVYSETFSGLIRVGSVLEVSNGFPESGGS
jgi:hypothetical protein